MNRRVHVPVKFSKKYSRILWMLANYLDHDYELPPGHICWLIEYEPLFWFLENDKQKVMELIFDDFTYSLFTGVGIERYIYAFILPQDFPRAAVKRTVSVAGEKDFFWKILGDRKDEFLQNCAEYKTRAIQVKI